MKRPSLIILIVFTLILLGCAAPAADEIPAEPTPDGGYSLAWLAALQPDTILIQQSSEPTFSRQEVFYEFGRVPFFTLYADGTVIYIHTGEDFSQQQVFSDQLSQEESLAMLEEFMDLGFEGLEDYLDICMTQENGDEECIADDAYILLSGLLPSGELRTVKSYGRFSNDPAVLADLRLMIQSFSAPDGQPYVPQKATLFITRMDQTLDRFSFVWPLEPSLLESSRDSLSAVVLEAPEIERFIETVGRNTGDFYVEANGRGYIVYMTPWLPGADFTDAIEAEFPGLAAGPVVTPAPVPEPIFEIADAATADLAKRLGIDPESIRVYEVDPVEWPNGCLGIVIPGTACTEALVPGFRLLLEADGVSYEYRSDMEGSIVVAADPMLNHPAGGPEAIAIASPGPGSRIVSPLIITGEAAPTFEQNLVIRILLADGTVLAEEPTLIQADWGQRGSYSAEVSFEVNEDQQGFIQVFSVSARDGGVTHLNSVGVLLAADGEADIRPAQTNDERIRIDRPAAGETIPSGVVHVAGFALASFEQTLIINIVLEDGTVYASFPVIVQAPDLGQPGAFSADIPVSVSVEQAGRIVVRDPSVVFSGDVHRSSIEVRFTP